MENSQENAGHANHANQGAPEQPAAQPAPQVAQPQTDGPKATLDIGSVIGRTFETLMKNPVVFFGLSFAVMVPPAILGAFAPEGSSLSAVVRVLEMVLGFIVQGAIAYAVYQTMQNKHIGIGDAVGQGTARLVPLVLTALLTTLGMVLGIILLIVPGIIVMCMWFVAIPACVVEKTGPVESVKRSFFLTKGYRWQIFALVLVVIVVTFVLVGVVSFMIASISGSAAAAVLIASLIGVVPQAFSSVLYAIVYYDLRVLKEGASLENLTSVFD